MSPRRARFGKARNGCRARPCLARASHEFLGVYPNARILVADETHSTEDKRHRILSRAATANRDVITITHSAFRFIAVPSVFEAERSVATTGAARPEPFATRQSRCRHRLNFFLANRRFRDCPASPTVPLEATSRLKRVRYCDTARRIHMGNRRMTSACAEVTTMGFVWLTELLDLSIWRVSRQLGGRGRALSPRPPNELFPMPELQHQPGPLAPDSAVVFHCPLSNRSRPRDVRPSPQPLAV